MMDGAGTAVGSDIVAAQSGSYVTANPCRADRSAYPLEKRITTPGPE